MKAKTIKGKSTEEIRMALERSMTDASLPDRQRFKPTLAIVFLSAMNEIEPICSLLDKEGIAIFGATTFAEFTEQDAENTGIAVLLLDINPVYFKIILKDNKEGTGYEIGSQIGEAGKITFANPGFIISSANYRIPGALIVNGLVEKAGADVTIVGGKAGEMINMEGKIFTNTQSSDNGIISLILDEDKITLKGMAASGWKPAGTEKKITHCIGPWIYTIDNQPAFDVVKKFLGNDIVEDKNKEGIVKLSIIYPLQLYREGGSPYMLPILFANTDDHSVMLAEEVPEGSLFRFSMPPDFDVIDMVIKSSQEVKEKEMPDADALVIFSCIGRLGSLGPMATKEVEGLADTWKSPMIGLYSLGEFGRVAKGKTEFHGTTVSWVALKEK
ncbi:MAG: FIST C-terminal domain-containing protein [Chitinophagaceae bacterium]|nr:FIST C-terminal domain-containing protein [Chitinophagaceae bacterium]